MSLGCALMPLRGFCPNQPVPGVSTGWRMHLNPPCCRRCIVGRRVTRALRAMQRQNAPVAAMGRHAAPHHAPLAAAAPAAAAGAGGAACASPPSAQQPGSSSGDSARGRRPRGRKRARGGDGAASPERPARTDCHLDPIDSEAKLKRQQDLNKAAQQRYRCSSLRRADAPWPQPWFPRP
jgi:hypothetical protein